ncbi:MAG: hydrogenase maturation nickel metallochaperone HypA [Georgfuchsia sp.]
MHELSMAESVIELIEGASRQENFVRVKTVFMEIGKLSCVSPDALRFAFEHVARETYLDGARLEIRCVNGAGECPDCRASVAMETTCDCYSQCGPYPLKVLRGLEMRVMELDVE